MHSWLDFRQEDLQVHDELIFDVKQEEAAKDHARVTQYHAFGG